MKRIKPNRLALSKLTLRQIGEINGAWTPSYRCWGSEQATCDNSGNGCEPLTFGCTADWRCA